MALNNSQEAWSEVALVAITPAGDGIAQGQDLAFAALTETIDIDEGDKPVEQIPNLAGGRFIKKNPQEGTTVTLEAYPTGIGAVTAAEDLGPSQLFHEVSGSWDTSGALQVETTRDRQMYRVILLWTDSTTATAEASVSASNNAYRWVGANGYMTSCKKSYTDGVLKFTFSFFFPPFDAAGTANIMEESIKTSDQTALAAITGYIGSTVRGW